MGVRRRLLREFLSSLKYIKNLTEQQIKASLWRGETTLSNVELEPDMVQQFFHDEILCGLEIVKATVAEVTVKIPWHQLMTQSIVIVVHDVQVEVIAHCEDEKDWQEHVLRMQRALMKNTQERLDAACFNTYTSSATGAFEQLRQRMVDGLQLQVSKATMSIMSRHPRHFPSHVDNSEKEYDLQEVLSLCGEDIILSPADSNGAPCHKLKTVASFCSESHSMQLNKFMKCRELSIRPGPVHNDCKHAVPEVMEAPMVLTMHAATQYPSNGSSTCPFSHWSVLDFESNSTVRLRGCECQLRAFLAIIMDVVKPEDWRLDGSLLVGVPREVNVENAAEALVNTSSVARTFAKGEQQAPPVADDSNTRGELETTTNSEAENAHSADKSRNNLLSTPVGQAPRERAQSADNFSPSMGVEVSRRVSDPPKVSPAPCSIDDRQDEAVVVKPAEYHHARFTDWFSGVGGTSTKISSGPLQNTSSVARTFAQGVEPRCGQAHASKTNSSTSPSELWKFLPKPPSLLGAASWVSQASTGAAFSACSETPVQMPIERLTGAAPATMPAQVVDTSSAESGFGQDSGTQRTEFVDSATMKESQAHEMRVGGNLNPTRAGRDEATTAVVKEKAANGHGGDVAEEMEEDAEDEIILQEDEIILQDSDDDFFSVGSVASGEIGDLPEGQNSPAQVQWLKPVMKWLGSTKSPVTSKSWVPEIEEVVKNMSVTLSHIWCDLAIADSDCEHAQRIELNFDGCLWTSESGLKLTAAQSDCLNRLARCVEGSSNLAGERKVDSDSIPDVLRSIQKIRLPRLSLALQQSMEEDAANKVELMTLIDQPGEMASNAMMSMVWQPRSAPAVILEKSDWATQTWPLHMNFSNAQFSSDSSAWSFVKGFYDRLKPSLNSKIPPPTMIPPLAPSGSDELFPTESMSVEMVDCEVIEAQTRELLDDERRWPMRVSIPNMLIDSRSDLCDLGNTLLYWRSQLGDEHNRCSSVGALGFASSNAAACTGARMHSVRSGDGGDVTIPKEMFDHLVQRAAEVTLKESQAMAAREELQKAYIALAGSRSSSLPAVLQPAHDGASNSQMSSDEADGLRRRCVQLESLLQSQCLAQRRLETELEKYQACVRDEFRHLTRGMRPTSYLQR